MNVIANDLCPNCSTGKMAHVAVWEQDPVIAKKGRSTPSEAGKAVDDTATFMCPECGHEIVVYEKHSRKA